MPDPSGPPDPPLVADPGQSLLAQISREMVRSMKKYYGRGPVNAKSYLIEDLLFVVMRGGTTVAEETMLSAGHGDAVRAFRQRFQNEMGERLIGAVEQLTGRRVLTYQSQILFEPTIIVEIFVFDSPADERGRRETAAAVLEALTGVDTGVVDEISPTGDSANGTG